MGFDLAEDKVAAQIKQAQSQPLAVQRLTRQTGYGFRPHGRLIPV